MTKEIEEDITHMEDKIVDYVQPLLKLKQNIKKLEDALLEKDIKTVEFVIEQNMIENILLRNWIRHDNYQ
jgi:hypothetical protein